MTQPQPTMSVDSRIQFHLRQADVLLGRVGDQDTNRARTTMQRAAGHTQLAQALMVARSRGIREI